MPRNLRITLAILAVAVLIGLISLRGLHRRLQGLSQGTTTEEQARRELLAPGISTPTDAKVQTRIYWAAGPDKVAPVQVAMALSADPAQRAKQVLNELIENARRRSRHNSRGHSAPRLLRAPGRYGYRGLFRCAGFGNTVWDIERGNGRRFHPAYAGK